MSEPLASGGLLVGRYEILRAVASGRLGTVHSAFDREAGVEVALKRIHPRLLADEGALRHFTDRMRSRLALRDRVVPLLHVFATDGAAHLASEWCEAPTLAQVLPDPGTIFEPVSRFVEIRGVIGEVALALGHAHGFGIVHGDLRPEGVVVTPDGFKVRGLGVGTALPRASFLAALAGRQESSRVPPELLAGRLCDTRGDVYAFAALVVELMSGDLVAPGAPPSDELGPLRELLGRALAVDPEQRPGSVQALLGELDRALQRSQPASYHPTSKQPILKLDEATRVDATPPAPPSSEDEELDFAGGLDDASGTTRRIKFAELEDLRRESRLDEDEVELSLEHPPAAYATAEETQRDNRVPELALPPRPRPGSEDRIPPSPRRVTTDPALLELLEESGPTRRIPRSEIEELAAQSTVEGEERVGRTLRLPLLVADQALAPPVIRTGPASDRRTLPMPLLLADSAPARPAAPFVEAPLPGPSTPTLEGTVEPPEEPAAAPPSAEEASPEPVVAPLASADDEKSPDEARGSAFERSTATVAPVDPRRRQGLYLVSALALSAATLAVLAVVLRPPPPGPPGIASPTVAPTTVAVPTVATPTAEPAVAAPTAVAVPTAVAAPTAAVAPSVAAVPAAAPPTGSQAGAACPSATALVPGRRPFCIDLYEYPGVGQLPRTGLAREAAAAQCAGRGARLCTDGEWERACRGPGGASFPYGNRYAAEPCNTEGAAAEPAGRRAECRSASGAFDLSGNVAEWTTTSVRGGAFGQGNPAGRCSVKAAGRPLPGATIGFRCCADPR